MKTSAFASVLAAAVVSMSSLGLAAPASYQDRRTELVSGVNSVLAGPTAVRIKPYVDDAQRRIGDAVRDAGARLQTPLQILDFKQKTALRRARRAHTEPDLALRPEQLAALERYAVAVSSAVAPIVRDDGAKIDALLTPDQRTAVDVLRTHARDDLQTRPAPAGLPDIAGKILSDNLATNGAFVLLVEIDPKSLLSAFR